MNSNELATITLCGIVAQFFQKFYDDNGRKPNVEEAREYLREENIYD